MIQIDNKLISFKKNCLVYLQHNLQSNICASTCYCSFAKESGEMKLADNKYVER